MCFSGRPASGPVDFFFVGSGVWGRLGWRMHRPFLMFRDRFADGMRNFFFVRGRMGGGFSWRMGDSLVCGASGLATTMLGFIFMGRPMRGRLNVRMGRTFMDRVVMKIFQGVNPHFLMADRFHFMANDDFDSRPLKSFHAETVAMFVVHEMVHFAMGESMVPFFAV